MFDYLSVPFSAFYSPSTYRRAARQWKGTGYLYLFLLLVCVWLLLGIRLGFGVLAVQGDPSFESFLEQIPSVSIENGLVTTDAIEPYYLQATGEPEILFVIDTTGEVTSLGSEVEEGLLLTRDTLYFKRSQFETREFDLSQIESFSIDGSIIRGWMKPLALLSVLGIALLMPFISLLYRIFLSVVLGFVGYLVGRGVGLNLPTAAWLRVAVVAMSPGIVLNTAATLVAPWALSGCFWWVALGAINLAYLVLGVTANRGIAAEFA